MKPGDTHEVEFLFPAKKLLDVEFTLSSKIDAEHLLKFRDSKGLPNEIMAPLRQEFLDKLESVGIKEFLGGVLNTIGVLNPQMTLADIARIRESVKQRSEQIEAKVSVLRDLFREFLFDKDSTLGVRITELARALGEFGKRLVDLDKAIGQTDLTLMDETVRELKQVQLATLRVEDTIRTEAPWT